MPLRPAAALVAVVLALLIVLNPVQSQAPAYDADKLYTAVFKDAANKPDFDVFEKAIYGFSQVLANGACSDEKLVLIDFSLPSTEKRMWVIGLTDSTVLFNNLVSHGKNSGGNIARDFSNKPQSYKSSLGFYVTAEKYHGKHGLSLRLDGLEPRINDRARERAIVIHGADYVSRGFINNVGRLGRSFGCPAVPVAIHKELINSIADGTCMFLWAPDSVYLERSELLPPPRL